MCFFLDLQRLTSWPPPTTITFPTTTLCVPEHNGSQYRGNYNNNNIDVINNGTPTYTTRTATHNTNLNDEIVYKYAHIVQTCLMLLQWIMVIEASYANGLFALRGVMALRSIS